jgi:hypothetical protein
VDIGDTPRIKPKRTHSRRKWTLGTHDARVHIPRARDHADNQGKPDTLGVSPIADNHGTRHMSTRTHAPFRPPFPKRTPPECQPAHNGHPGHAPNVNPPNRHRDVSPAPHHPGPLRHRDTPPRSHHMSVSHRNKCACARLHPNVNAHNPLCPFRPTKINVRFVAPTPFARPVRFAPRCSPDWRNTKRT